MTDWKHFWQQYRILPIRNDRDLLYQVGKTVSGNVISTEQFICILQDIQNNLALQKHDDLLDLACGNGVLTHALAQNVRSATGIDFSKPYIENARKYKSGNNITYIHHDINELADLSLNRRFSKILLYDALAYFNARDIDHLFGNLTNLLADHGRILFASVLDHERRWNFFNTFRRKINYVVVINLLRKNHGLGTWWKRETLRRLAAKHGLRCTIIQEDPRIHTAHYRIDIIFERNDP